MEYHGRHQIETVKALITDWNIVVKEGWEVVERGENIVVLKRVLKEDS